MKATEFAYWMQGYFEINGGERALTQAQALQILKKSERVKPAPGDVEAKAASFVSNTQDILSLMSDAMVNAGFLESATGKLKNRLNDLFIHAIDPSYEGNQQVFNDAHQGKPAGVPRPPYTGARC